MKHRTKSSLCYNPPNGRELITPTRKTHIVIAICQPCPHIGNFCAEKQWRVEITALLNVPINSSGGMTIGGASSGSRSSRVGRFSQSKIRHGSSSVGGGSSTLGGHPMKGPEPGSPVKRDIKHRFEITKKLGSGTYGKVSLAYDHKTDREVAVKLIKKSAIENKQDLVRIRREIRIMSALHHPNIIQIYEVFENKDKIILVMEYACGGELYDYVSTHGSLPEAEARRIFRQITSAVLYCHKHKVAHRDLKLENILLDGRNNAKIADFGLSNYFSEKSLLTTFCGSPLYASPEIINGTPYRGPEVDCWSLGILLYTLVYGSMPFDGRDFNRMVRQIKRGAYFEPDTPSTASMLIRSMLRVNPDRRADIDDIASHWWLNLEENMPVIQELPENQITDHTPLTEREETMVVQDLANETDVFMEFGHLSSSTRQKIEDFRRRRQEAEEYNENSPVKVPKLQKNEAPVMTSKDKSLRGGPEDQQVPSKPSETIAPGPSNEVQVKDTFNDPLERLRQLETRLGRRGSTETKEPPEKKPIEYEGAKRRPARDSPSTSSQQSSTYTPEDPVPSKKPAFVPLSERAETSTGYRRPSLNSTPQNWKMETDSLNVLMNQVLEQMENGPVSMNLVARIQAHPYYNQRPMVKELLESILAAQPPSVQKQASKIIQQQSQDIVRRQISNHKMQKEVIDARINETVNRAKYQVPELPTKVDSNMFQKPHLEERQWHSVEVGFETDDESEATESAPGQKSAVSGKTAPSIDEEVTDEDITHSVLSEKRTLNSKLKTSKSEGEIVDEETEDEDEEEEDEATEEEYDSEIEELADEVEQVAQVEPSAPKIVTHESESIRPEQPVEVSGQHLAVFDRGLVKRQSKGKYQVLLYGRGVSTEADSPPSSRRFIGGPQPLPEQSPILFDKAKKYIMSYPNKTGESDDEIDPRSSKKKQQWLKSQDPDIMGSSLENPSHSATPTISHRGSVPPRTLLDESEVENQRKDNTKAGSGAESEEHEEESGEEEEEEEEEDEEEEEEEEEEIILGAQKPTAPTTPYKTGGILGIRTVNKETTTKESALPTTTSTKLYTSPALANNAQLTQPTHALATHSLSSGYGSQATSNTSQISSIESKSNESTENGAGMQRWETAAAYIRRKNRERRQRNRTIGTVEEAFRINELRKDHEQQQQHQQPSSPSYEERKDPFDYHHHLRDAHDKTGHISGFAGYPNNYGRSRYEDSHYRRAAYDQARSGSNIHQITQSYIYPDRSYRKSYHELSPTDRSHEEERVSSPVYGGYDHLRHPRTMNGRSEEETLQSWANEPRRFEVYQTRAERAAEKNTTSANHPSYRTGTSWLTGERPLSAFIPGAYKSRYDDNFSYRRSAYDVERPVTPSADYGSSGTGSPYQTSVAPPQERPQKETLLSRFRPVTRRVASAFMDGDRKNRARSQSTDRKHQSRDESDYHSHLHNRLMTPEVASSDREYNYVNYYDSGAARGSQPREPDMNMTPARGILKNKQSIEIEPRPKEISQQPASHGKTS
uniref:Protein kinase domain-containing protein n=1 Tax=Steinernema glaseri TaxID=37863 RepID=A0A1I7YBU1_9BILA